MNGLDLNEYGLLVPFVLLNRKSFLVLDMMVCFMAHRAWFMKAIESAMFLDYIGYV